MLNRLSVLTVSLLTLAFTAAPAVAGSGVVGSGVVGAWNLDQGSGTKATDSSGNGNDGAISGGATWVAGQSGVALSFDGLSGRATWVAGQSGVALSFDGLSGQVKIPDSLSLEPSAGVTVSAWVEQAGTPGNYRYILAKGATGCIAATFGLYTGPNGGLQFYVSRAHGTTFSASPDAGAGVWDGNWHVAVGTYDGSSIRLYVDGAQVGAGTLQTGSLDYPLFDSNDLFIGNYPGCAAHGFLGVIDNVTVWGHALSQTDVAGLLPGGTGGGAGSPGQTSNPTQPGSSSSPPTTGTTPGTVKAKDPTPSVRSLRLLTDTFTIDPRGRLVAAAGSRGSITYTVSQAAELTITLLRSETGVRRGNRCVKPRPHQRLKARRCSHYVVLGSFRQADQAGQITLSFEQLLRAHRQPGEYRLDVTPRAHGNVGKTVSVRFVIRRSHAHH